MMRGMQLFTEINPHARSAAYHDTPEEEPNGNA